jgi:hypothetical protein
VLPLAEGGAALELGNLVACCGLCNRRRAGELTAKRRRNAAVFLPGTRRAGAPSRNARLGSDAGRAGALRAGLERLGSIRL